MALTGPLQIGFAAAVTEFCVVIPADPLPFKLLAPFETGPQPGGLSEGVVTQPKHQKLSFDGEERLN